MHEDDIDELCWRTGYLAVGVGHEIGNLFADGG